MSAGRQEARYKVALLLTGNVALTPGDFSDRWLSVAVRAQPAGPVRYIHNAAASADVPIENAPPAPFDAVDELLFDSAPHAAEWFGSAQFRDDWLAPRAALLAMPIQVISGCAIDVWCHAEAPSAGAVKILTLPVRRPGMTMAAFADHWVITHAGLALGEPGTRDRLRRLISTPADRHIFPSLDTAPFDGIGTIQFDSLESLHAAFASDHYREVMAADELRFTDAAQSRAMMVREIPVHPG